MTCTSCSARVERKLNKLDGVSATVNFATESADIDYDPALVQPEQLIAVVEKTGYGAFLPVAPDHGGSDVPGREEQSQVHMANEAHAAQERDLAQRAVISLLLSVPVMVLSMVPSLQFEHWQWVVALVSTPVFLWGGAPFHRAALKNLRHGSFTMDTLISLGTSAAWLWSMVALFWGGAGDPGYRMHMSLSAHSHAGTDQIYLESASMVVSFLLLGRWGEHRAKGKSSAALYQLLNLGAKEASVLRDNQEYRIPAADIQVGDVLVVRPGEKIPTDAEVIEGHSAVDESMISGESIPVEVNQGSQVTGATLNTSGRLVLRATRVGKDTTLAHMAALVTEAQTRKAPVQRLVDKISQIFVPAVILIAIVSLILHLLWGSSLADSFSAAVAVLIIACPCALGLATPTALLVGSGRGAQLGLLIRGPEVLESSRAIDTVVLDKTGTITTGHMDVDQIYITPNSQVCPGEEELLRYAASVEKASEHPIAQALVRAAQDRQLSLIPVQDFQALPGRGVDGRIDGHLIHIARFSGQESPGLARWCSTVQEQGSTVVVVSWDGEEAGALSLRDQVKKSSASAISSLRRMGLEVRLLSGDNAGAVNATAREVGIAQDHVTAGVLPEDKVAVLAQLQQAGYKVAMVGDGINDAAALAQADLGLAMGAGTDVAIEASDITLMNSDLESAVDALKLSRRTLKIIHGNLFWAFAYNVLLIPVAALGFLNPMFAGAAMALSSIFVVSNSLRLRNFRGHQSS
ncbi:cadmium-translocating P-type ATPase [Corynebacterium sp. 3HC-13]|uniref:heavy metal translocating P-type ATPase n=1 Tax=Corynebacterium poyangense TaxID=2684405 RepID=UPI001CCBD3B1|nr:heavy metal translocating P-type ATPase [Corynebacterium poyangense]MBZ8177209.1 cadmium-translocating P-type ATPase [Corynebacterium poyangense]